MTRRCLGLLVAVFALSASASDIAWQEMIELAPPNGDAMVKSLAMFPDGRMAALVEPVEGDLAVMQFDAGGSETGRWLALPPPAGGRAPHQHVSARPDGNAFALLVDSSGWRGVTVAPDGSRVAAFALGAGAGSQIAPVFGAQRVTVLVNSIPANLPELRSYDYDGALLASLSLAADPFDDYPPAVTGLHGLADGGFALVETRYFPGVQSAALRRLDAALETSWRQDFSAIPATELSWFGVRDLPDGGLLLSGTRRLDDELGIVVARVDAQGALQWHASTAGYPRGALVDVSAFPHAGGIGLLGVVSNHFTPACLFEGTLNADGSALTSACTPFGNSDSPAVVARRERPGGLDLVVLAEDANGPFLLRIAKRGAQPATLMSLSFPLPLNHGFAAVAVNDTDAAAAFSIPRVNVIDRPHRLLHWDAAGVLRADSPTPAADSLHVASDTIADADGSVFHLLRGEIDVHLVHVSRDGSIVWDRRLGAAIHAEMQRAADGSFRVLAQGDSARLVAVGADGSVTWTHEITDAAPYTRMAVLSDASVLLAVRGAGCQVRRVGADGMLQGQASLQTAGEPLDAVALDEAAVFACGNSAQRNYVHVDKALQATPISPPPCIGVAAQLVDLGGDRWGVLSGESSQRPVGVHLCRYAGATPTEPIGLSVPGASGVAWERHAVHMDPMRGELHVAAAIFRPEGRSYRHVVLDRTSDVVRDYARDDALPGESLLAMSGVDSRGRVGYVYGAPDAVVNRVVYSAPSLGPKWSEPFDADPRHLSVRVVNAGEHLRLAAGDPDVWNQTVRRFGTVRPDALFDGDFE